MSDVEKAYPIKCFQVFYIKFDKQEFITKKCIAMHTN